MPWTEGLEFRALPVDRLQRDGRDALALFVSKIEDLLSRALALRSEIARTVDPRFVKASIHKAESPASTPSSRPSPTAAIPTTRRSRNGSAITNHNQAPTYKSLVTAWASLRNGGARSAICRAPARR
jgi:hypothetical protein